MPQMKHARGNSRRILSKVGTIQSKIGLARNLHFDDRSPIAFETAQDLLKEAFDICLEITSEYYPIKETS